jgi:hypothetical protein
MIKKFFANVDGDKIHFFSIEINSDGSPINSEHLDKDYALSNNPTVLNITSLGYFPARRSIWNGESFVPPEGQEHKSPCNPIDLCQDGCETIAFLVNNVYYGGIGYCVDVYNNNMLIAALSSSPVITFEILGG